MAENIQQECLRCGKCCEAGGPALHGADLDLIHDGKIPLSHLVTVRKGELSVKTDGRVAVTPEEFVKLAGASRSWSCRYYRKDVGCSIYENRPLACRTLKCWDTADIENLVGHDLLNRRIILGKSHQMLELIEKHDAEFSCDFLIGVYKERDKLNEVRKKEIERMVQGDLQFRDRIVQEKNLSLGEELFFFGRPLFQLLRPFGVTLAQVGGVVVLRW